jgi:hypothetical protein
MTRLQQEKIAMTRPSLRHTAALVALGAVLGAAGATTARLPAPAEAAPATETALRHQFINNLDAKRNPPDARGRVSVTFRTPLPAAPTILVQCANPRYTVKVHDASPAGFVFALYRTREILDGRGPNPFEGEGAAKPVTDFREAENIDIAFVALTGG